MTAAENDISFHKQNRNFIISGELALIIVVIIMVSGKSSESFTIRGYSYPGGQMLYGDVPEKISAGGQEYDNPLYLQISRRWEPTDKKVNGYTVWKQKGQSSDQSTTATTATTK